MNIVHLTSSRFFGGPERQMLELARSLPRGYRTTFASFSEGGRCQAFLEKVRRAGLEALQLERDTPRLATATAELVDLLRRQGADLLCCHGYKADILGRLASRAVGVPAIAVSRGWTGETLRVRLYDFLDRAALRTMDRVVCVSEGQAVRVRHAGVRADRVTVIHNAIRGGRFEDPGPDERERVRRSLLGEARGPVVVAAGRLSPEKGFDVLVEAAALVTGENPEVRFILFGDGPLREELEGRIASLGLTGRFVLAGFRADLDSLLPCFELMALPSFTEGLPNVVLEAFAAGIPVVATAVGGTPEVVEDRSCGHLVPPGDPAALARRVLDCLASETGRRAMGLRGRERVLKHFTFDEQARRYTELFEELVRRRCPQAGDPQDAHACYDAVGPNPVNVP